MTPAQKRVFEFIDTHKLVRRKDIEANFNIGPNTSKRHLQRLSALGAIYHRYEPSVGTVWATSTNKKLTRPWSALASQESLKPYEQASSVWEYARRCAV